MRGSPVYINGVVSQIYLITNTINGKKYIGQTTYSMKERWRHHTKSVETRLGRDIRKFGEDKFSIIILAENIPIEQLDNMERFYIKQYETCGDTEYNVSPGGKDTSAIHKLNLSNSRIGLKFTDNPKPVNNKSKGIRRMSVKRCKPVRGTHLLTGEIINLDSMSSDDRFDVRLISAVCRGKRRHHHGYKWEYV